MSKVILEIKDDQSIEITTEGELHFQDMVTMFGNATLHLSRGYLEGVPLEHQESMKEQMYDYLNQRFTSVLELFAPEYELRPGLTEEAIMKAENEVLLSKMSE